MLQTKSESVRIFGVLVPIAAQKVRVKEMVRFRSKRDGGLVWDFVAYKSWEAASRATGLSVATMRWKLEGR